MHYRRFGDSGPDLVLLHEAPLSSVVFDKCLPILGRSARAVAFDLPGYGASDPPSHAPTIKEYSNLVIEAIELLGIEDFALAGVHTGAAIGAELISQDEDSQVTHAIFTGMPLLDADHKAAIESRIVPPQPNPDGSHMEKVWAARQQTVGESGDFELCQLGAIDILSVYERYDWGIRATIDHDAAPALKVLKCPVLFLNGAGDRMAKSDEAAAALVPDAKLEINPDMGSQIPWHEPDYYARVLLEFLGVGDASVRNVGR